MVSKERIKELFESWYCEQCDSWRDDCEESGKWREQLTDEEKLLVAEWDRETPEEMIRTYSAAAVMERDKERIIRFGGTTVKQTEDSITIQADGQN